MRGRLSAALCAVALAVSGAPPAAAEPVRPKPGNVKQVGQRVKNPISLKVTQMTPQTIAPKTPAVTFSVTVTNSGTTAVTGVRLRLFYGGQITTRSELDAYAKSNNDPAGMTEAATTQYTPFDMKPGEVITDTVKWNNPGLIADNAPTLNTYPLAIKAIDVNGQQLDSQHTFVTYVPKDAKKLTKTKVSFIWPLIDRPHRTTDSVFLDTALAKNVTSGRLNTLVKAVEDNPNPGVTLAIDPALPDDLSAMSAEHFVDPPKIADKGKRYPKDDQAVKGLDRLRLLLKNNKTPFFLTPYADPDSGALIRQGLAGTGTAKNGNTLGLLPAAYRDKSVGLATLQAAQENYPRLAWPASGTVDQGTLDRLVTNYKKNPAYGSDVFLLSSDFWTPGPNGTQTAPTTVGTSDKKQRTAIAFDDTIQNVISGNTGTPEAVLNAEQRYLAETAVMTAESPSRQRSLVVAPDRRWSPGSDFAQFLLKVRPTWLKPVTLKEVANGGRSDRVAKPYDTSRSLSKSYVQDVKAMDQRAVPFSKIFIPKPNESLRHAGMRASATYWRGNAKRRSYATSFVSLTNTDITQEINKVRVLVDSDTNKSVTGSSANVLLTLVNDLAVPVKVQVQITSGNPYVLLVEGEKDTYVKQFEMEPHQKVGLPVPMKQTGAANRPKTPVEIQIFSTAEPMRLVSEQEFFVSTNDIPPVGWLITIGALVIMGLGVGFRGMRARRRRKAEAETEEAQHDGAATG